MAIVCMLVLMIQHVAFDIPTAFDNPAAWFQANPVLANIVTIWTSIIYGDTIIALFRKDIVRDAMWAVPLRFHCEEASQSFVIQIIFRRSIFHLF